jgi:mannose-6-phosphate isomerase-like protein (cupin superfamily)
MSRRATPRPTYSRPAVVRPEEAVRHLWGDEGSGLVGDEVLLSSDLLHALVFTLPPGGRFGHSPDNRTVFAADEVYVVLEGTIAVADPQSGQVCRAEAGDCVFFRRDTWHHGANWGRTPVRVLELFSPPPATGSSSAYARTVPYLEEPRYAEDGVLGRWPMARAEVEAAASLTLVGRRDQRLRAEGDLHVGVVCSTEHLTVTDNELLPGCRSPLRRHGGEALLHVTEGVLHVHTPDNDGPTWWQVRTADSFVVPAGVAYRLVNQGNDVLTFVLGAAPGYLPEP